MLYKISVISMTLKYNVLFIVDEIGKKYKFDKYQYSTYHYSDINENYGLILTNKFTHDQYLLTCLDNLDCNLIINVFNLV